MLLWLRNIDFAASPQGFTLPGSVEVGEVADVTVNSGTVAVVVTASPDITIQTD